jgi:tripartite-type tricarboxylate transporter receptor subunit TctC
MAAASVALSISQPASAQSPEAFYKGKQINMAIGFSVGGGYDLYGRLVARHLGKHIPGRPTVVPQNMAGAGSLRAANFLYSVAPKDGTTIGTFARANGILPLLDSSMKFDATKFAWLGSVTDDVSTCVSWHTSPIKTWQDFVSKPVTLGGEGPASENDIFALLYRSVFGINMKLVSGYPGTAEITLAMERGEVDGLCGLSLSTLKARHAQWIKDKKVNILSQATFHKSPDLPNVPMVLEVTKDPEKLQILKIFIAAQEMARPFVAPPDVPADRRAALTAAFAATMSDADFLADAKKASMDVSPISGAELARLLDEIYATPKDVLAKAAAAIARQ